MEAIEAAWLAGFFEGEGTATIQWRGNYPGRVIHLDNSDKDLIEYISKLVGQPMHSYPYTGEAASKGRSGVMYRVYITGAKAVELARFILPYVKSQRRRKQLERIINPSR